MEAPRQKLMKERATVVATTTLAVVVVGLLTSSAIYWDISQALFYLRYRFYPTMDHVEPTQAIQIASELRARGFQAWLVGGCVRDLILGREPKDYDISTDARPDQLVQIFPKAQLVGAQFGVILVDGVEGATFRSDHSYNDGRRPVQVTFETDRKKDVLRPDFTINALLLDPTSLNSPNSLDYKVIDAVGGLSALR